MGRSSITPTKRTLDECRRRDWPAGVAERWKPGFRENRQTGEKEHIAYGTRVDFLGFADILVLDGQPGYLAIQACAGGDLQRRLQKAMDVPELIRHLEAGNRFQVWAWREVWVTLKSGKAKRKQWRPKIVSVILRDGMLFHQEETLSRGGDALRQEEPMTSSTPTSNPAPAVIPAAGAELPLFEET
jgi:hypothetical protein